jgi:hypothetical protein
VSSSRRITIDNTLDERLRLLEDKVGLAKCWVHSRLTYSCRCSLRLEETYLGRMRTGSSTHERLHTPDLCTSQQFILDTIEIHALLTVK